MLPPICPRHTHYRLRNNFNPRFVNDQLRYATLVIAVMIALIFILIYACNNMRVLNWILGVLSLMLVVAGIGLIMLDYKLGYMSLVFGVTGGVCCCVYAWLFTIRLREFCPSTVFPAFVSASVIAMGVILKITMFPPANPLLGGG